MNIYKGKIRTYLPDMISIFTFVCIVYQMLVIIYPVKVFFARFPFNMFSKGLCIFGLILILTDIITDRIIFNGISMKWVILMILSAVISTIFRANYDCVDNIKCILWSMVQMLLIYTLPMRITKDRQKKLLIHIHSAGCIIFIPVLIYMFYQFVELEHYINANGVSQGWFEGRLFGVMDTLYKGASLVAVLLFGSVFLFAVSKSKMKKAAYLSTIIVFFTYIALSDSRSIYAGCCMALLIIIFFDEKLQIISFLNRVPNLKRFIEGRRRRLVSVFLYIITITVFAAGIMVIRNGGMELAYNNVISKYGVEGLEKKIGEGMDIESARNLGRPKQATITSRRVYIWKSYAEIILDKPSNLLIGLSPEGYDKYIIEHYPESYIVKDFWEYYPLESIKGNVYGTHNAYLHVLVATGILGMVSLLVFLIWFFMATFNGISTKKNRRYEVFLCAIIIMMLTSNFFEGDIFYCTTAMSFLFWLITGILVKRENNSFKRKIISL